MSRCLRWNPWSTALSVKLRARHVSCVTFVEWCCERDSDLTRWVIRHGGGATRLCLPQRDMQLDQQVEQVIRDVRTLANQGIFMLVWASLPCTRWCSWQRINQVNKRTAQRLKESRRESELMMEKFRVCLEGVRVGLDERSKNMIRVSFEWPRAAYDSARE
eukprot:7627694-Heterocapsa_arctica.AAC.1